MLLCFVLVKMILVHFLPFCLCLLVLPLSCFLSFFQDLLILLHLIYYFPIPKCNPQPQPAAPWPKCPLFSQQQVIPAWWEAAQKPWQGLLPCLEAAHGLYFSCGLFVGTFYGQILSLAWQ